jgi:hypothetical protein
MFSGMSLFIMHFRSTLWTIVLGAFLTIALIAASPLGLAGTAAASEHAPADETGSLNVSSNTVGNAFHTDETPTFEVRTEGDIQWSVQDYWGGTVVTGDATVDGTATLEVPIEEPGYYEVTVESGDDHERRSFAVLEPDDRDIEHSFFGIHAAFHKSLQNDPNQLIELVDMMGAEHVRGAFMWSEIEHEPGVFEYPENYRDIMTRYERRGIRPLVILRGGNLNYFEPVAPHQGREAPNIRARFTFPPDQAGRDAYADYGREIVTRYPDQVDGVEIWNEPNIPHFVGFENVTPAEYSQLVVDTYPAIKDANPDVRVAGGSLAFSGGAGIGAWTDGIGEADGLDSMDTLAVHPYRKTTIPEGVGGSRGSVEEEMNRLEERMAGHTDDPPGVTITEIGWPTNGGQSQANEREQSQYLTRTYILANAAGVDQVYYYGFKDQEWKLKGSGAIVRSRVADLGSMAVKRGFVTYGAMTRSLKGATFEGKDDLGGEDTYSYVFDRDGTAVRAMWSLQETDATIETDQPVTVRTAIGETRTLEPADGEVELTLSADPLYVHGAVDSVATGANANVTAHDTARGSRVPVTLAYDNTDGDRERSVTFEAGNRSTTLRVPAGERRQERVRVAGRPDNGPRNVHAAVWVDGTRSGLVRDTASVRSPFEVSLAPRADTGGDALSSAAAIDLALRNYRPRQAASVSHVDWTAGLRADDATEHSGTVDLDDEVDGGGSQTVSVPLEGVGDWEPYRPYTVNATVHFEGGETIAVGETVTPFSPAPRHTVTVDADVAEEGSLPAARLPRDGAYWLTDDAQSFEGRSDLGGRMRLTQDQESLYLQLSVRDDVQAQPSETAGKAWQGDSVQFAVAAGQPGDADRFSVYTFALNASGEPVLKRVVSPRAGGAPPPSDADLAIVRHEDRDRTVYELAVPWSELAGFDGPADTFSASLLVNDNDGDGRKGWVEWGSGVGQTRDSALFRPIQRVGAAGSADGTDDGGSATDGDSDSTTADDASSTDTPAPTVEETPSPTRDTPTSGDAPEDDPATPAAGPGLGILAGLLAGLLALSVARRRS